MSQTLLRELATTSNEVNALLAAAFADKREWRDRVRCLNSGAAKIDAAMIVRLDDSMAGHSYTDRVKTLLAWLE